jgi:hypothetical protein
MDADIIELTEDDLFEYTAEESTAALAQMDPFQAHARWDGKMLPSAEEHALATLLAE